MRRGLTMEHAEQLRLWVAGESVHNGVPKDPEGECCPDFSCCKPELQAPKEEREHFASLPMDDVERDRMLGMFLGRLLPTAHVSAAQRGESD